jgi:tetratricopeptide (TPR) repeat protein
MAQYREAIRRKPDYAEAHFNLGCDLQRVPGRVPEAISEYREAVRLKPGYFAARCNLGNALASEGLTSEALAEYAEALRLRPDNGLVHFNRAIILMRTGASRETVTAELREAVRLDPGNVAARDVLARVLARISD